MHFIPYKFNRNKKTVLFYIWWNGLVFLDDMILWIPDFKQGDDPAFIPGQVTFKKSARLSVYKNINLIYFQQFKNELFETFSDI